MQAPPNYQPPQYTTTINHPTAPLEADVVDKLINRDIRAALFSFLNNSEEVKIKTPIYDVVERPKLDANGTPLIDKKTGKTITEKKRVQIGTETHRKLKSIYEDDEVEPFINAKGAREIIGLVELSCNSATRTSYFKQRDLTEAGKTIAANLTRQIIIRYRDYGFKRSTSRSISLFEGLAMIICATINPSENGAMLNVVQNTHKFNSPLENQPDEKTGIINFFKRVA